MGLLTFLSETGSGLKCVTASALWAAMRYQNRRRRQRVTTNSLLPICKMLSFISFGHMIKTDWYEFFSNELAFSACECVCNSSAPYSTKIKSKIYTEWHARQAIGILIRNVCPEIKCTKFVNGNDDGPLQVDFPFNSRNSLYGYSIAGMTHSNAWTSFHLSY